MSEGRMVDYVRVSGVGNEQFRDRWVRDELRSAVRGTGAASILDVGAGSSPFKNTCDALGLRYVAHDFGKYDGAGDDAGLQCGTWRTSGFDVTCDILDIPQEWASDVVLCTEVLEHVPDPIRALERMSQLVKPSGTLIITVPFMSFMHQAPYWFQGGLSPYWFDYWIPRVGLRIQSLTVTGDYVDFVDQELDRVSRAIPLPSRVWRPLRATVTKIMRTKCPDSLRVSAGFGTFCVARAGA